MFEAMIAKLPYPVPGIFFMRTWFVVPFAVATAIAILHSLIYVSIQPESLWAAAPTSFVFQAN